MARITVSAYEINIHKFRDKDNLETLNDFNNGIDLLSFLRDYIANWTEGSEEDTELIDNQRMKKVLRLSPGTLTLFGRGISGIIDSGEYGYTAEIIDKESGEKVHDKELNHAEMIPFFFKFYIPEDSPSGILLIQRFKQFGIYRILRDVISRKFSEEYSDYRVTFKPLVSSEIVNEFLSSGFLKKITFKKLNLSPNLIDQFDEGANPNDNLGHIEYSIVANRGKTLPYLKRIFRAVLSGEGTLEGLIDVPNFDYNKVNVSVNLNGHSRTLDLSSLNNVGAFFDITAQVVTDDSTGHPTFESLKVVIEDILNDLISTLNNSE